MGKVEEALRAEIRRLARKELRTTVGSLSEDVREIKRTVARLLKVVEKLDKEAARQVESRQAEKKHLDAPKDEVKAARLTGRVIKNLRKRLGLSQEKLAVILRVSPGTVAAWEQGRARPRGKNKTALVALRKLGRRDGKSILADKS